MNNEIDLEITSLECDPRYLAELLGLPAGGLACAAGYPIHVSIQHGHAVVIATVIRQLKGDDVRRFLEAVMASPYLSDDEDQHLGNRAK